MSQLSCNALNRNKLIAAVSCFHDIIIITFYQPTFIDVQLQSAVHTKFAPHIGHFFAACVL